MPDGLILSAMRVRIIQELPLASIHREKLAVGTEHETIPTPAGDAGLTRATECWVRGANEEPVRLLASEFDKA